MNRATLVGIPRCHRLAIGETRAGTGQVQGAAGGVSGRGAARGHAGGRRRTGGVGGRLLLDLLVVLLLPGHCAGRGE